MDRLRDRFSRFVPPPTAPPPATDVEVRATRRAGVPPTLTSLVPRGPAGARLVTLLTLLFWATSVSFLSVTRYGGDFRALLCLGEHPYHPAALDSIPRVGPSGYDGQQYGALATDPLLRKLDTPEALDAPAYRATRFLLPLTAWLAALGRPTWAVVAYQLLCWGLGLGAVCLVAFWLVEEGRSPWWALPLAGGAGLVAAIVRSMPDAAAVFLVLLALWLYGRGRTAPALLAGVAAVLTRETSYLGVIGIVVDLLRRRRIASAAVFAVLPVALLGSWQVYLKAVLGTRFFVNRGQYDIPFTWLGAKFPTLFPHGGVHWLEVLGLVAVAATTLAFVLVLLRPSTWAPPEVTFVAFGTLGLVLTSDVYVETWSYARVLLVLPFLATLMAERQQTAFGRWTLRAIPLFYLLAGLVMMRWEVAPTLSLRGARTALQVNAAAVPPSPADVTAPAGVRPLYILPVANAEGRSDARWRTKFELVNLAQSDNTVLAELLPAGRPATASFHRTITLAPGETRRWENLAGDLFAFSGTCAVCLFASAGPVAASSLTTNSLAGRATAPLLPALTGSLATLPGQRAAFRGGLYYDPEPAAAVRTNIGFVSLCPRPLRMSIEAFDSRSRRLGGFRGALPARGFLQVDDIFRRVEAGPVAEGSAVVQALEDGAFLSYASVIRGPTAPAVYLYPESSPAR